MKNKGFIKLYRNVLTKPEMTDLVAEQGAAGLGVYIMVLLYLSQCDDFEGAFTNGQLSAFAARLASPAVMCVRSFAAITFLRFTESVSESRRNRR